MTWKNSRLDALPQDGERVLISVRGVYYMATYQAKDKAFYVKEGPGNHFYVDKETIYWDHPDRLPGKPAQEEY